MAKGESRTSRVGGTQDSVLASETEWTENCCVMYTAQTVKRDECKREFVSTPDALLKIISAILGPIWKEVTEEKQGGCVGQCRHVDVDLDRRESF